MKAGKSPSILQELNFNVVMSRTGTQARLICTVN
eukprot:Gb_13545 [translate_table: standard]